ncbi:uncharacterized protein LOC130725066 [Lotus japonicus]|uniref:uncharacterized protein LOC130725066 n=1 Tax=Lotus japonicus TaxID=34305 RepID=UPI002587F052|nr:uncharacterized protein LOC130725066 [Lotus japonicus]
MDIESDSPAGEATLHGLDSGQPPPMGRESPPSFRDTLMGSAQQTPVREVEDLWKTGKMTVAYVNGDRQLPKLFVDRSVIEGMCSPWKDALVVNLLGKRLGYRIMKTKLSNLWRLSGDFALLDVDNGFFLVKFDQEEDKRKVIDGGPWMIFDHYLAVATWNRSFICPVAQITTTLAWIRIPGLNVTYYNESFLLSLAKLIGKPIKVDRNTLNAERGRECQKPPAAASSPPPKQPEVVERITSTAAVTTETLAPTQQAIPVEETPKKPDGIDPTIVVVADPQASKEGGVKEVDPAVLEVAGDWLTVKYKKKKKSNAPTSLGSGAPPKGNIPPSNQRQHVQMREGEQIALSSKTFPIFSANVVGPSEDSTLTQKKRKIGDSVKNKSGPGKGGSSTMFKGKDTTRKLDQGSVHPQGILSGARDLGNGGKLLGSTNSELVHAIGSSNFMEVLQRHEDQMQGGGVFHAKPPNQH